MVYDNRLGCVRGPLMNYQQAWVPGLPNPGGGWVTTTIVESEVPVGLAWAEIRWMIGGTNVAGEYFKTEDEAIQKAKVLAAKQDNITEVLVFKVVRRVRPVPKEVEVVDVKD